MYDYLLLISTMCCMGTHLPILSSPIQLFRLLFFKLVKIIQFPLTSAIQCWVGLWTLCRQLENLFFFDFEFFWRILGFFARNIFLNVWLCNQLPNYININSHITIIKIKFTYHEITESDFFLDFFRLKNEFSIWNSVLPKKTRVNKGYFKENFSPKLYDCADVQKVPIHMTYDPWIMVPIIANATVAAIRIFGATIARPALVT